MADAAGSAPTGDELRIWVTVWRGLCFSVTMIPVAASLGTAIATAATAFVALGLMPAFPAYWTGPDWAKGAGIPIVAATTVLAVIEFVAICALAVLSSRRALLGVARAGRFRLSMREGRYVLATILVFAAMFLVLAAVVLPLFWIGLEIGSKTPLYLGFVAGGIGAAVVYIRTAFVFPAIAVDAPATFFGYFKASVIGTRGRFWELLTLFLGAVAPFITYGIAGPNVGQGLGDLPPVVAIWFAAFIHETASLMMTAALAATGAYAFRAWSGWTPEAVGEPAAVG